MGERAEEGQDYASGGADVLSPSPSPGLMARHYAAMQIVGSLSTDERYELLAAVVWPENAIWEDAA